MKDKREQARDAAKRNSGTPVNGKYQGPKKHKDGSPTSLQDQLRRRGVPLPGHRD